MGCRVQWQNLGGAKSARDELAAILREAAEGAISSGLPVLTHEGYADAVVAAGWRFTAQGHHRPGRTCRTADGTVILDALGVPRQLTGNRWVGTSSGPLLPLQVPLPATVLHVPP